MGALKAVGIEEIMKRGSIKDVDVKALRAAFYDDGIIGLDEAQMLFAVNRSSPVQDPAWTPFFIEAITDFIVNQAQGLISMEDFMGWQAIAPHDHLVALETQRDVFAPARIFCDLACRLQAAVGCWLGRTGAEDEPKPTDTQPAQEFVLG